MTGSVYLIGLGPGYLSAITPEAIESIQACNVIISPEDALPIIDKRMLVGKILITQKMSPIQRSELAIQYASTEQKVAIIALGHPGFFAIASSFFGVLGNRKLDVQVIPGMTMIDSATAELGSPLGRDYAVVSIADQASPWEETWLRVKYAIEGNYVLVLYNPIGKLDDSRLKQVINYAKNKRNFIVGLYICIEFGNQKKIITDLEHFPYDELTPISLIIIGNTYTTIQDGRMVTLRPYLEGKGY